jgi:hypothetical protein
LQPCRREPNDCRYADEGWCGSDECNGDGTRWVTVGRLVADENTDFSYTIEADA